MSSIFLLEKKKLVSSSWYFLLLAHPLIFTPSQPLPFPYGWSHHKQGCDSINWLPETNPRGIIEDEPKDIITNTLMVRYLS